MATRPQIPYFAPAETLPAPLPTMDEILDCDVVLRRLENGCTKRVGKHYVAKYSSGVRRAGLTRGKSMLLQEGENMLFIKQATSIPVPTVYALYRDRGFQVIVMEYVEGKTLKELWPKMPLVGKETFTRQIRRYLDELKAIASPGYYGGIWEQGILDPLLTQRNVISPVHASVGKPCRTESDWCEMMIKTEELQGNKRLHYHQEWINQKFRAMFSEGHPPVFTHGEIVNRSNLKLRPDGVVVPLDWSAAGWYPSYWEYCSAMEVADHDDDWTMWIGEIFEGLEHMPELGWMVFYRRCVFHHVPFLGPLTKSRLGSREGWTVQNTSFSLRLNAQDSQDDFVRPSSWATKDRQMQACPGPARSVAHSWKSISLKARPDTWRIQG